MHFFTYRYGQEWPRIGTGHWDFSVCVSTVLFSKWIRLNVFVLWPVSILRLIASLAPPSAWLMTSSGQHELRKEKKKKNLQSFTTQWIKQILINSLSLFGCNSEMLCSNKELSDLPSEVWTCIRCFCLLTSSGICHVAPLLLQPNVGGETQKHDTPASRTLVCVDWRTSVAP